MISHLVAFEKFGRNIKPHGNEWKYSFQRLTLYTPRNFPSQLPLQAFQNPTQ
jgi:predicted SprT family Zn-dependent metalloprotease